VDYLISNADVGGLPVKALRLEAAELKRVVTKADGNLCYKRAEACVEQRLNCPHYREWRQRTLGFRCLVMNRAAEVRAELARRRYGLE
jgi:hypothetical protein